MGSVLTALADKVYRHRLENKGYVPIEVFEQLLGPVTVSVQIVHEVLDIEFRPIGFALRLRDAGEAGDAYRGKYHNTCASLRWLDNLESALVRDDADAFGGRHEGTLDYIGVTYHHEVSRRNMDLTFMHRRRVTEGDVRNMNGEWKVFTPAEIRAMVGKEQEEIPIVLSNVYQLLWALDTGRGQFGVLTGTFPDKLLQQK